jgi:hypothetical protein
MKEAEKLPTESARRRVLMALAAPVQLRVLGAALVPGGILLGPMVLPFMWFGSRIDPAVKSAPAGTAVTVVASVDAEYRGAVRVEAPAGWALAEDTPAETKVPAIREALEKAPPELSADLIETGIVLTGGSALLRHLDRFISRDCGLPVRVAQDPLSCVIRGLAHQLNSLRASDWRRFGNNGF